MVSIDLNDNLDLQEQRSFLDQDELFASTRRQKRNKRSWPLHLAMQVAIYMLALYGAGSLVVSTQSLLVSKGDKYGTEEKKVANDSLAVDGSENVNCFSCGFTAAEAVMRGCIWEEMDMQWLHPRCVDLELREEYAKKGHGPDGVWMFETEAPGGDGLGPFQIVNSTELSLLVEPGRKAWSTMEHHLLHCNYRWRKQFRTRHTGVIWPMPREKEAHVSHCGKMTLMKNVPLEQYRTRVWYNGPAQGDKNPR